MGYRITKAWHYGKTPITLDRRQAFELAMIDPLQPYH
jgi:hypothetical protein